MDLALHALNRFGLGARIGERRGLSDPRGWVVEQLDLRAPLLAAEAAGFTDPSGAFSDLRAAQSSGNREAAARARRRIIGITAAEMNAALLQRLTTDAPYLERLVAFWSNHLCVSLPGKIVVAALAGAYAREAIRPHVLGRFEDMVLPSASHQGVLL
jgi:uncharacterized protein (DUF1800 family)